MQTGQLTNRLARAGELFLSLIDKSCIYEGPTPPFVACNAELGAEIAGSPVPPCLPVSHGIPRIQPCGLITPARALTLL